MKRFVSLVCIGALIAVAALSGCAMGGPQQLTPAQIITIACPPIQAALVQFETIDASLAPSLPAAATAAAALKIAQAPVAAACTAGASISTANVQAFATTVLPALGTIAGTLPMPASTQAEIQGGLLLAETAVGVVGVVQAQIDAAKAAAAPVSASAPVASAPAALSTQ
jgi:hypothetical protein